MNDLNEHRPFALFAIFNQVNQSDLLPWRLAARAARAHREVPVNVSFSLYKASAGLSYR